MEFRFQEKARAHGCFIVSAAGFDSIPADLGTLFTQRQFQAPAVPSSVTSFLSIQSGPAGACGTSSCQQKSQKVCKSFLSFSDRTECIFVLSLLFTRRHFQAPAVPSPVTSSLSIQSCHAGAWGICILYSSAH